MLKFEHVIYLLPCVCELYILGTSIGSLLHFGFCYFVVSFISDGWTIILLKLNSCVMSRAGNGKISASGGDGFAGGGGGRVSVNIFSRHDDPIFLIHGEIH